MQAGIKRISSSKAQSHLLEDLSQDLRAFDLPVALSPVPYPMGG